MSTLPRSTRAGRGELTGPAATPRQVRSITVRVEEVAPGMLRLSSPATPGWAAVARTPLELARGVAAAFTEAQVAAYSQWRGHAYDGEVRRRRPAKRGSRCDVYDPREWQLTADGRWLSPGGRLYPEDRQAVQRVMAARRRLGLPPRPDPCDPEPRPMLGRGEAG